MKKTFIFIFLAFFITNSNAEIVNLQKEEKEFGDWKAYCEIDPMVNASYCKLGARFFDHASVITIEPNPKSFNQLFIVIPKIRNGSFLQIRVDQNDFILSPIIKNTDFGLIPLTDEQKILLFKQMKNGAFLFFRFKIRDSDKEITTKINLADFRSAIKYYIERTN